MDLRDDRNAIYIRGVNHVAGVNLSQADSAARRIRVVVANFFVGGVVIDERIHVPRADREKQSRAAELPPRLARLPGGLAEDRDPEPGTL